MTEYPRSTITQDVRNGAEQKETQYDMREEKRKKKIHFCVCTEYLQQAVMGFQSMVHFRWILIRSNNQYT